MNMKIEDAALRYLSSRSRTIYEMTKHLQGKGFSQEEIEKLTETYRQYGYLDDQRYCREYFRYAFGKGKGKRKVFCELREKGVASDLAEIAFEDYLAEEGEDFDEKARAKEEAMKVLRQLSLTEDDQIPEKVLGRIGRKLQSKGYGSDVIYGVLGALRRY